MLNQFRVWIYPSSEAQIVTFHQGADISETRVISNLKIQNSTVLNQAYFGEINRNTTY